MTDEHTLQEDLRHPQAVFSTWVGVVLLFGVFGLFVWVMIGASQRGDTYEAKRATARAEKLKTLREEASKALTTYGWVDKAKGVTHIPIDRAMELTLADLVGKKPAPANPVVVPEPQASAAPAPNAVPPKAGAPSPLIKNDWQRVTEANCSWSSEFGGRRSTHCRCQSGPSAARDPARPVGHAGRVDRSTFRAGAAISIPGACHTSSCKSAARARENAMSIVEKKKTISRSRPGIPRLGWG